MSQRTVNNAPFGWRIFGNIVDDITELFSLTSGGAPAYDQYTAFLTQFGTGAPTADDIDYNEGGTPIIDTINGVWSYSAVGKYRYTKVGAFADVSKIFITLGSNNGLNGPNVDMYIERISNDVIELSVFEFSGFTGAVTSTLINSKLSRQPIEIRVYS